MACMQHAAGQHKDSKSKQSTSTSESFCCYRYLSCSDLQGLQTHAVRDGDDYILNGSKVCGKMSSSGKTIPFLLMCDI